MGLGTGSPGCLEGVTSYQSLIVAMDTQVDGRPWSDGVLTFSAASFFKIIQLHLAACLMPLRPGIDWHKMYKAHSEYFFISLPPLPQDLSV